MRRRGKDAADRTIVFVGVALLGLLPGCGSFRFGFRHADEAPARVSALPQPQTADPDLIPQDARSEAQRQQEVLSAVEAFLKRTEAFDVADAPARSADAMASRQSAPDHDPLRLPSVNETAGDRTIEQRPITATQRASVVANSHITARVDPAHAPKQAIPIIESVAIQVADNQAVALEPPPVDNLTNQAISAHTDRTEADEDDFLAKLESQADQSGDVESLWRWRLVQLALRREGADQETPQDVRADVARLLDAVLNVAREARLVAQDPLRTGQEALAAAQSLVSVLAERADPLIPKVALCSEVVTFGVYKPIEKEAFRVGHSLPAIVYIEVDNFTSERVEEDAYRTLLATRLELLTNTGESVWQQEEPEIVDRCHRRRRDFFIAQRIALPATLSAGDYVLKVLVEDKLSGKANEAILPITINAPSPVVVRG
ncbi:MAG: hypothetical protein ACE5E5_08210 [Phycisphaerae bacterium]